jgi:diguanylate cyclase
MVRQTPQEVAREALKLLASRRLSPTPDNFQSAFHEVAGTKPLRPFPLDNLRQIATALPERTPGQVRLKTQFERAVRMHSWDDLQKVLLNHAGQIGDSGVTVGAPVAVVEETALPEEMREQMARIVENALPAVGNDDPRIAQQADELVHYLRLTSQHQPTLRKMMADFAFRLSFVSEEQAAVRGHLLDLLRSVFENIGDINPSNPWLRQQMDSLVQAAQPPLSARRLEDLQRKLRDVIHKEGEAKERELQAQALMKEALSTFIERLGEATESNEHYQDKLERCATRLQTATSLEDLAPALQETIEATQAMAQENRRVGDELQSLRERSTDAEEQVRRLQAELDRMSAVASHDMLTGVLNRKGMEEVVERELAHARRNGRSTCLALLDIDDFKKINDEHGHAVGDAALKHLTDVARSALRPTDAVARYGGEEFVIILPDTEVAEAEEVITRLQRSLTTRLFLEDTKGLLITFSAGVTQLLPEEGSGPALQRADQAMYLAKRSGKNRVYRA